jgi:hypothetical protein
MSTDMDDLIAERDEWRRAFEAENLKAFRNGVMSNALEGRVASLTADLAAARQALAEARDVVRMLLGTLEIASVMPEAIGKVYVPRLDATELSRARDFLARTALLSEAEAQGWRDG